LREYCLELRELKKQTLKNLEEASIYMNAESKQQAVLNTLRSRKEEQMEEVYRIVVIWYVFFRRWLIRVLGLQSPSHYR